MSRNCIRAWGFILAAFILVGCASSRIHWAERVGVYTYDQTILELGPPDRSAKLSDGTIVAEWLTSRGNAGYSSFLPGPYPYYGYSIFEAPTPSRYLRLTFGPEGSLKAWREVVR